MKQRGRGGLVSEGGEEKEGTREKEGRRAMGMERETRGWERTVGERFPVRGRCKGRGARGQLEESKRAGRG